MPALIDRMIAVPDAASVAGAHWLHERTAKRFGPSSGTNVVGALRIAREMHDRGEAGSVVTFGCDDGERYADSVYDPEWLARNLPEAEGWKRRLNAVDRDSF